MTKLKNQVVEVEILKDLSGTGRERPWRDKKMANEYLAIAYDEVDPNKAVRLRECATTITFKDGRLSRANFCRVRLCPMCAWRRGLKIFGQTMAIMEEMKKEKEFSYIFLTFTVKNCVAEDLSKSIDLMMSAWDLFIKYVRIKKAIKGWYRGFEVTHNLDVDSKDYDTFHPHFHCVFAVNKSYYTHKSEYLTQAEWTSYFKKAMKIDYDPIVHVKKVKGNTAKAVAEIAKYAVKVGDYIIADDWELTVNTVRILDSALNRRRLVAFGGKFRELHKKLNLDDTEDGDLTVTDATAVDEKSDVKSEKVTYSWNIGYTQYLKR